MKESDAPIFFVLVSLFWRWILLRHLFFCPAFRITTECDKSHGDGNEGEEELKIEDDQKKIGRKRGGEEEDHKAEAAKHKSGELCFILIWNKEFYVDVSFPNFSFSILGDLF